MGSTPPRRTGRATLPLVGAVSLLPVALTIALVGIALPLIGCGGAGTDSTSSGTSASTQAGSSTSGPDAVTIADFEYKPASIGVPVGTVVRIANHDTTAHTVTSKQSGAFESGAIQPGKTGTIRLEKPGTYSYYCAFHPFMKGTITVE